MQAMPSMYHPEPQRVWYKVTLMPVVLEPPHAEGRVPEGYDHRLFAV